MALHLNTFAAALSGSIALHAGGLYILQDNWGGNTAGIHGGQGAGRNVPIKVSLHATAANNSIPDTTLPAPQINAAQTMPAAAASEQTLLPGLRYFTSDELDRRPKILAEVPLVYPVELPTIKRGHIVMALLIDETGRVDRVIVESADAPGELQALASSAFSNARFMPGQRANRAVKSRLKVEVTFETEEGKAEASPQELPR